MTPSTFASGPKGQCFLMPRFGTPEGAPLQSGYSHCEIAIGVLRLAFAANAASSASIHLRRLADLVVNVVNPMIDGQGAALPSALPHHEDERQVEAGIVAGVLRPLQRRLDTGDTRARHNRLGCQWRSHKPVVWYKGFLYQAASWKTARRVVAKVEFHVGELFPRVGFIVTNLETG